MSFLQSLLTAHSSHCACAEHEPLRGAHTADTHEEKGNGQRSAVAPALVTSSSWGWRFLIVLASAAVLLWMALKFSVIIISILIALLLAVVVQPLVGFLRDKWHWPDALAAGCGVLLVCGFLVVLLYGSGTGLYQGFTDLGENIQNGAQTVISWVNDTFPQLQTKVNEGWAQAQRFLTNHSGQIAGGVMSISSSVSTFITSLVLVFFSLFFFLKDGRGLWQWFVRLWPEQYRTQTNEAGIRAWVTLGNYARTQTIVALFDAVAISVVAVCLGTPFTLVFPIAAIVFLCAFIPVVGALLSGAVAVLVVLVNTGQWIPALIMLIGVLVVQQIEGNLISPLLQGNALNIHAWAILILVMAGSTIAGIFGALFTVPLAAAINTMILYLHGHDTYPYLRTQANRPGGPYKEFEEYTQAHWDDFDENVAQKLPPREARKAKRAAKKAARAAQENAER